MAIKKKPNYEKWTRQKLITKRINLSNSCNFILLAFNLDKFSNIQPSCGLKTFVNELGNAVQMTQGSKHLTLFSSYDSYLRFVRNIHQSQIIVYLGLTENISWEGSCHWEWSQDLRIRKKFFFKLAFKF